jgi:hypothetical protein
MFESSPRYYKKPLGMINPAVLLFPIILLLIFVKGDPLDKVAMKDDQEDQGRKGS